MKKFLYVAAFILLLNLSGHVYAEEAEDEVHTKDFYYATAVFACLFGIGIGAAGAGIGQGLATKGAVEGIARNPGTSGKVTVTLIIGLALMESLVIYSVVVALIILYAKPFGF